MIALKSSREIEILEEAGAILRRVLEAVEKAVCPGVRTETLDAMAEEMIVKAGGRPAFKGYRGFPKTACISINEEVVHGIPGSRKLQDGDIVSFDIGVQWKDYFSDAARTWPVGKVSDSSKRLIEAAKDGFFAGVDAYYPGCRLGDISEAIQRKIESSGFHVIRDYVGHGIGRAIHEEPQVPNFGTAGKGPRIEAGMVLAIEPMVTEGGYEVEVLRDGWTVVTRDRKRASHYENTVVFTEKGYRVLT
ncbi:MAG: type I methionyl aminopeptidase [Candidatus Omnitrophota bacterium]